MTRAGKRDDGALRPTCPGPVSDFRLARSVAYHRRAGRGAPPLAKWARTRGRRESHFWAPLSHDFDGAARAGRAVPALTTRPLHKIGTTARVPCGIRSRLPQGSLYGDSSPCRSVPVVTFSPLLFSCSPCTRSLPALTFSPPSLFPAIST